MLLFICCGARAAPAPDATKLAEIAAKPSWLRLLKADKTSDQRSAVNSPEFFVTGDPNATPYDELAAFVRQIDAPVDDPDIQVRCRFPARAYWLAQQMQQPAWRDFSSCKRLSDWARLEQLDSISLIMISGYFGNPASTFGHSLLRINNSDTTNDSPLLDLGINFGAQVPPNEATVVYILRGLFGGYQAGFSDRTFFEHDQTYSRIEFRDRWEYTLALSEAQRTFLTLHIWELASRKFTYYFLEENCSYRLAELLELVFEQPIVDDVSLWYAPVSLFHDLRAIDTPSGAFTDIRYVPSVETTLRASLERLSDTDRQIVFGLVSGDRDVTLPDDPDRQQRLISAALDYFAYQLAGAEDDELSEVRQRKNALLLKRLALPIAPAAPAMTVELSPPSSLAPPSAFDIGIGKSASTDPYLAISVAAFRYSGTGNDAIGRSSLVVADVSLGVNEDAGLFVDRFDMIRARKINAPGLHLPGENRSSWEVGVGARRARQDCLTCLESYADAAYGRTARLGDQWRVNLSLAASLSSKDAAIEMGPRLMINVASGQSWAAEIDAEIVHAPDLGETRQRYRAQARLSLSNRDELSLAAISDFGFGTRIYYSRRW